MPLVVEKMERCIFSLAKQIHLYTRNTASCIYHHNVHSSVTDSHHYGVERITHKRVYPFKNP